MLDKDMIGMYMKRGKECMKAIEEHYFLLLESESLDAPCMRKAIHDALENLGQYKSAS